MKIIETPRLILRTWTDSDADEFYRINQDPKVIEFLAGPLSMEQVHKFMATVNEEFKKLGYTLWAAEEKSSGKFMGYIGLFSIKWDAPFAPAVDVGWRLGSEFWGHGWFGYFKDLELHAIELKRSIIKEYGFRDIEVH